MIKREDLVNTYIVNDKGVLRDTYIGVCKKFNINLEYVEMWPEAKTYGMADHLPESEVWADFTQKTIHKCKQLHLSDLINLENSKVYTTDLEVVRKYAELCGVKYNHHTSPVSGEYVGVAYTDDEEYIARFTDDSYIHLGTFETTTVTLEQVNALYAEKFGQTETTEVKEAFDVMAQGNEQIQDTEMADAVEWKNGDECTADCLKLYDKCIWVGYGWKKELSVAECLKGNTWNLERVWTHDLRKPETEAERKERERLESAYDLAITVYPEHENTYSMDAFVSDDTGSRDKWLVIVDKTGYRKQ